MKKRIISIICGLLIAIAVVLCKLGFSCRLNNTVSGIKGAEAMGEIDNLFIGSSLFRCGIDIFEAERLSDNTYVLTYDGNQPVLEYEEINYLVEHGVKIGTVYFDMHPNTVSGGPGLSDTRVAFEGDLNYARRIWTDIKNDSTTFKQWYDYFVSANNDYFVTFPVTGGIVQSAYHKGGRTNDIASGTAEFLATLTPNEMRGVLDDEQTEAIRKLDELCTENGIDLVFVETPKYYIAIANGYTETLEKYIEFVEALGREYILADFLEFDNSDPEYYSDLNHLSAKGETEFTRQLVDWIISNGETN